MRATPQGVPTTTMPVLSRAQFEAIARVVASLPYQHREVVALRFAASLHEANPLFMREKFLVQCGVSPVLQRALSR